MGSEGAITNGNRRHIGGGKTIEKNGLTTKKR